MKQGKFIEKNKTKWKAFEAFLNNQAKLSPDELAAFYVEIIDDLSYVQSSFPRSKLEFYLNELALKAHQRIYKTKKEDKSRFLHFFKIEIPLAIKACHRELGIALLVFVLAIVVGVVSSYLDMDYSRIILGDSYVNMTMDNISKGDPMGVYRDDQKDMMFFGLGSHNIQVAIMCYMLGMLGAIFSGFILVKNGLMVGAFQTMFVQQGLFWTSFSTIFIHGALELSAIVIVGGAGMVLGNSWWYPGTYTRIDSLIQAGQKSMKVLIAIIPVIVIAAFLESYVTYRYQEMRDVTRLLIILFSFAYIAWYFIIYPIQVHKKMAIADDES